MMSDYDKLTAAGAPPEDPAAEPGTDPAAEVRPRAVGQADRPATSITRRLRAGRDRGTGGRGAKTRKRKVTHPRVSLEKLIESGWGVMARLCAPVSQPLSRCLEIQSPVAGMVLEDAVKGTFVDTALQPFARAERRAKMVAALVVPPMCVAAAEAAQGLPDQQRAIRLALIEPVLLESLTWWAEVAGDKLEARMERERETGPARELAIRLFQQIFGPPEGRPDPGPAPSPDQERDQAVSVAQSVVVG
jgi:hypothetical protein